MSFETVTYTVSNFYPIIYLLCITANYHNIITCKNNNFSNHTLAVISMAIFCYLLKTLPVLVLLFSLHSCCGRLEASYASFFCLYR